MVPYIGGYQSYLDAQEEKCEAAAPVKAEPSASKPAAEPTVRPTRLFVRVPSQTHALAQKAKNLLEIFDGAFPVYFYYADEKRYESTPIGVAMSDYVLRELRALLGAEHVILK